MDMKERLQELAEAAGKRISESEGLEKLNEVRVAYLGKKGELTAILKSMKDVAPEERPKVGQLVNEARKAIEETILEHSMKYQEVITWSTDGFFRETKEKVAYRKSEGCAVVEMECSALAACADFRGATWGMILYTADSLADVDKYDERNWGGNAYEYALTLCLDAVIKL